MHRKDVWITSKLWNAHHKPEEVARVSLLHFVDRRDRCTGSVGTHTTSRSRVAS